MKYLFVSIINAIISFWILTMLFPSIQYSEPMSLISAGIVVTFLQIFVRPILKILFLPINIITLGLFSWVINVLVLWLTDTLVPGFDILPTIFLGFQLGSVGTLLLVTFMLSLTQTFVGIFIRR